MFKSEFMILNVIKQFSIDLQSLILWIPLESVVEQAVIDDAHIGGHKVADLDGVLIGPKSDVFKVYCRFIRWN